MLFGQMSLVIPGSGLIFLMAHESPYSDLLLALVDAIALVTAFVLCYLPVTDDLAILLRHDYVLDARSIGGALGKCFTERCSRFCPSGEDRQLISLCWLQDLAEMSHTGATASGRHTSYATVKADDDDSHGQLDVLRAPPGGTSRQTHGEAVVRLHLQYFRLHYSSVHLLIVAVNLQRDVALWHTFRGFPSMFSF